MPSPFKQIVVLMMENRSFDHMLGYLKAADYPIDGLDGDETNPSPVEGAPSIRVSPDAQAIGDLSPDPQHEFEHVNTQIFGNAQGTDTGQQMMQGFVTDYASVSGDVNRGNNIMKCFHRESLPVLSALAQNFAVCDRWFSSVPGSTIPNRLFAHCATSGGSLTQDAVIAPAKAKTIFEVMDDPNNKTTYRIYTDGATILMANLHLAEHQDGFFDYSRFRQDCKDGLLPAYTFIEPSYDDDIANGILARSQHPDFAVDAGEALIAEVYDAIRSSDMWNDTLLLILYDEHGGLYDHVPPPKLTLPQNPDIPASKDFGFQFDRLGLRVPAVFVSPRISAGRVIHTEFDHCSIVATVRKMFCLDQTPFSWREARAATFDDIADLSDANIRTDNVVLPAVVASNGANPMARAVVLSDADRAAANAALAAQGSPATPHAADANCVGANAPVVPTPAVRTPTDLTMLMARAMQNTLNELGLKTQLQVGQIVTAQDAATYLQQAANALQQAETA